MPKNRPYPLKQYPEVVNVSNDEQGRVVLHYLLDSSGAGDRVVLKREVAKHLADTILRHCDRGADA